MTSPSQLTSHTVCTSSTEMRISLASLRTSDGQISNQIPRIITVFITMYWYRFIDTKKNRASMSIRKREVILTCKSFSYFLYQPHWTVYLSVERQQLHIISTHVKVMGHPCDFTSNLALDEIKSRKFASNRMPNRKLYNRIASKQKLRFKSFRQLLRGPLHATARSVPCRPLHACFCRNCCQFERNKWIGEIESRFNSVHH